MPRERLQPGRPGKPSEPKWNADRKTYEITCLVGEPIGKPSRVWASGPTKPKARAALNERIGAWKPRGGLATSYLPNTKVNALVRAWLAKYESDATLRPQNVGQYRKEIIRSTHPSADPGTIVLDDSDLGNMNIVDVQPYHVRLHLESMTGKTAKQKTQKAILGLAFQLAVDDGSLPSNPVRDVKGFSGERGALQRAKRGALEKNPYFNDEPRPFTPEEMAEYRRLEAEWKGGRKGGKARLLDFTMLAYDLCARPGEAAAVRFDDIDFATGVVKITGTVVTVGRMSAGKVVEMIEAYELAPEDYRVRADFRTLDPATQVKLTFRQPFTKTKLSGRSVKVSAETLAMLRRRKMAAQPGQRYVLINERGGVMGLSSVQDSWLRVVKGSGLEWASLRTLRSTKATRVAERYGIEAARIILGHVEGSKVTHKAYVPDVRDVADFPEAL